MSTNTHNLDINMYSFKDILNLFNINGDVELEDLKRAKKKVLMLHPDKSKLSSEYFLFYKKAYEIIFCFFEDKIKQSKQVPNEKMEYSSMNYSKETQDQMNKIMEQMKKREFQAKFNEMWEKNIMVKPDESKNDWFKSEDPQFDLSAPTHNSGNLASRFEKLKEQNKIVKHTDIRSLHGRGTNLYDEESNEYIDCDPFSKLKYDDLRKVHKDETVLSVSEKDFENVKTYNSVDHYQRERKKQTLNPIEKSEAEKMIQIRQKEKEEMIRQKQYQATLKSMDNEKKNQQILSSFLRLTN